MTRSFVVLIALLLPLLTIGCDKEKATQSAPEGVEAENPSDEARAVAGETHGSDDGHAHASDSEKAGKLETVEVAQSGTTFDPAVKPEQLPAGAWYCDMGTVHWAAMEQPADGACPECGMKLKVYDPEKLAAQKEKAVEPHAHEHEGEDPSHAQDGHSHGHGAGDHGHTH